MLCVKCRRNTGRRNTGRRKYRQLAHYSSVEVSGLTSRSQSVLNVPCMYTSSQDVYFPFCAFSLTLSHNSLHKWLSRLHDFALDMFCTAADVNMVVINFGAAVAKFSGNSIFVRTK